ncbi:DUF3833 domain-containing protein [Alteromonas halophila]|uniref:DUF3833 domain-containing protein n=1 Tax=Alteromonas halophila TaxID=516698 RepID=A0A918JRD9_9ALTE|nr:DUF3833 domain-containing protein [Alteromonas halophila]GGW96990.1 hypothetical protein GCM10007391_33870 [Alteromonas halophila]
MRNVTIIAALAFSLMLTGCTVSVDGDDYTTVSPDFNINEFFDGNVKAWGIVQDRSGKVMQRFIVDIDGRMENGTLILDESFDYGLGEGVNSRTWKIQSTGNGTYRGEAGDIVGTATGKEFGNAFNFQYEMDLPVDGSTYRVTFDDWFWAFNENAMMNRSYIRKFGLVMAEVTIFMQKQS